MTDEHNQKLAVMTLATSTSRFNATQELYEASCKCGNDEDAALQRETLHTLLDVMLDAKAIWHAVNYKNFWFPPDAIAVGS